METKIKVMLVGGGNVGLLLAKALLADERFKLMPEIFVGDDVKQPTIEVDGFTMQCIWPTGRNRWLHIHDHFKNSQRPIMIDFSQPSAVLKNAYFYANNNLPFVMGTTGNDRVKLLEIAGTSVFPSLIAPNMCMEIVWLTMVLEQGKLMAPDLFINWQLDIVESHQAEKKDPSGTALAMARNIFAPMGANFNPETDLEMVRTIKDQLAMGVPTSALKGHGWHSYTLSNPDDTLQIGFTHNVNGRAGYVAGTIEAILFVANKVKRQSNGVYNMQHVLEHKAIDARATEIAGKL